MTTDRCRENCVEWIWGDKEMTVSLSSPRHISRIRQLAFEHPEVKIVAENSDGSICARLPVGYLKFNAPKNLSDEQRRALAERAKSLSDLTVLPDDFDTNLGL